MRAIDNLKKATFKGVVLYGSMYFHLLFPTLKTTGLYVVPIESN